MNIVGWTNQMPRTKSLFTHSRFFIYRHIPFTLMVTAHMLLPSPSRVKACVSSWFFNKPPDHTHRWWRKKHNRAVTIKGEGCGSICTHDAHLGEVLSPSDPRSFNLVAYLFYQYINGTNSAMLFQFHVKKSLF